MRATSIAVVALLVACGDNTKPMLPPDDMPIVCGDGVVQEGEDCDDKNVFTDAICDATCHFTCGNGFVDADVGELCDPGITSGPGACPTSCDDGVACTIEVLNSSGCTAECVRSTITVPANGDGCCPAGANANNDDDCVAMCDNGEVEPGELCDTGIPTGPGACPTACDDMLVCTTDVLASAGTCLAACSFTPITLPANDDGCCPSGGNSTNDNDCSPSCGNGVLEPPEICDTAIIMGNGACPTACDDGDACTSNVLDQPMTCQAACVFPQITMPTNGDGCCPGGANANNDNDCAPVCGNGVPEPGEGCDDGNTDNTDTCSNSCTVNVPPPTAFRFSDLDLKDPHVYVDVFILGCTDVTNTNVTGFSVNGQLQTTLTTDGNADGLLDLSPTVVFRSFSQTGSMMPIELHFANCTAPIGSTSCTAAPGGMVVMGTATNMTSGTCLAPIAGTTRAAYSPAIVSTTASPTGACFVTNPVTVTINIGGIPITLHDARLAGQYVGNPASSLANGLLRGFISETDANATMIPPSIPIVGGDPLSSLLPGGMGSCPSHDDRDVNGVRGWWFYLNFTAARVPWM